MTDPKMISGLEATQLRTSSNELRSAAKRVRKIAAQAAAEMGIEISTVIVPMFDRRSQEDALRVVLSMADVEFVLLVDEATIGNDDRAFLAVALRARIEEICLQHERFAERIATTRERVEASIEKAQAGMHLDWFGMAPLPVWWPFDWRRHDLEAAVATLDPMLKSQVDILTGCTGRCFAGDIRSMAPYQRRRRVRKARLDAHNAVFEIDALADAAIASSGRKLGDVANELRTKYRQVDLRGRDPDTDAGSSVSVVLWEGRVILSARLSQTAPTGLIHGSMLRVDSALSDGDVSRLIGRPAGDVLGDDALVQGATITSAKVRNSHYTDLQLRQRRRFVRGDELLAA